MFSICKKIAIGSALMSVLYGCSQPLEDGIYIVDSVKVGWSTPAENENGQEIRDQIANSIKEDIFDSSYLKLTDNQLHYYLYTQEFSEKLDENKNVKFSIGTLSIKNNTANSLDIESKDFDTCKVWQCIVNIKFTKTNEEAPRFQEVNRSIIESKNEKVEFINEIKKRINEGIQNDYVGEKVWLDDNLAIKLKPSQLIGLRENYEIGRTIQYGDLVLNKDNEKIYNIEYSNQYNPSGNVTNIQTSAIVSVVPSTSNNIDFSDVKNTLSEIYYEDNYGFVGQGKYGRFAFYYYYDERLKSYVVSRVAGNNVVDVIDHYVSLRSIDSDKNNQNIISAEDFALSVSDLEDKYNVTLEGLFQKESVQKNYSEALKRYFTVPDIFYNSRFMLEDDDYISVNQYLGLFSFKETLMKFHAMSLDNKMAEFIKKYPDGKRFNDIFVFSVKEGIRSGFVYLFEPQKDMTVEIFVPRSQGHQFEKVMYGKLLESLDFSSVPKIDARIIPNIGKYTKKSFVDNGENAEFYEFEEGKTDLFGNLLTE